MTVKAYVASAAVDPANPRQQPLPAESAEGSVKTLISTQEIANGDSIASTVKFGSVPSNARLLRNSTLDHDAITGLTSLDLTLCKGPPGAYVLPPNGDDCLMTAQDVHLAGNKAALGNVDIANLGKAAWEIAGYTQDPGGNLEVVATLDAAATAAGTLTLTLLFATP